MVGLANELPFIWKRRRRGYWEDRRGLRARTPHLPLVILAHCKFGGKQQEEGLSLLWGILHGGKPWKKEVLKLPTSLTMATPPFWALLLICEKGRLEGWTE